MPNDNATSRESQMALYQITVSDLTYFKSQQWSLTNHAILLLAGIVGASQLLGTVKAWERIALTVLVLLVVLAGQIILTKLENSIIVRQARLHATREKLGFDFHESWAAKDKEPEAIHAVWILRGAILIGGVVAGWILVRPLAG
jgi:hypothetical protein